MKFTAESTALRKAVAAAASVILSKNTMPILDNILVRQTEEGKWQFVSGSDSLQVVIPAPLIEEGKITRKVFCVPANLFANALKELGSQPLEIELNETTLNLHVTHQTGSFDIMSVEADAYPIMEMKVEDAEQLTTLTAEAEPFVDAMMCGIGFCGVNEAQAVMTGVCIDVKVDSYTFAGTDGKKLYRNQIDCGMPGPVSGKERTCIVQPHIIRALKNVHQSGEMVMTTNGQKIQFRGGGWQLIGSLVDGNYPAYNKVIPTDCPIEISINTKELVQAVKRVKILANRSSQLIRLSLDAMMLRLEGSDLDYATSAIESVCHQLRKGNPDDNFMIGLSADILLQELSLIQSDCVLLQLTAGNRPAIIREDAQSSTSLMLAMPMKV